MLTYYNIHPVTITFWHLTEQLPIVTQLVKRYKGLFVCKPLHNTQNIQLSIAFHNMDDYVLFNTMICIIKQPYFK